MISHFKLQLPWCNEQPGTAKLAMDRSEPEKMGFSSAVGIPIFKGFNKRQLGDDSHAASSSVPPQVKKPRLEVETSHLGHSRALNKTDTVGARAGMTHAPADVPAPSLQTTSSSDQRRESNEATQNMLLAPPANKTSSASSLSHDKADLVSPLLDTSDSMTPLQQVIDNEFNMAMLMKHNELRLIEQELAKCQIALEQLRRCELRPFPGYDQPSHVVSEGTGAAILPSPGFSRPAHGAPFGVTDGPYSRHYRQWLLNDPDFDSMSLMQTYTPLDTPLSAGVRSTRNQGSVRKSVSSRTHAVSARADPLPSIPNYPAPAVKDKSAPLVLRRSTDNQMVKLICNNCLRGNFSSIQGFLNHCRIAHKVDYKSHDLAAIDCGRLLDENDLAKLPPPDTPVSAVAPTPRSHVSRASTSAIPPPKRDFKVAVHPLNTPAGSLPTPAQSERCHPAVPAKNLSINASATHGSTPLKPSSQMPRLSALFAKHGAGGDLEQAFANAKQKVELHADDELLTPDTPDSGSPSIRAGSGRMLASSLLETPSGAQPPPSRKGYRQPAAARPKPSPLVPIAARDPHSPAESFHFPQDTSSASYSPHAADSNPGLVSDREDDDDHASSASDDETPHSDEPAHPIPVGRHCSDNVDVEMTEPDHEMEQEQHQLFLGHGSMLAAGSSPQRVRPRSASTRKMSVSRKGN